MRRSLLMNLALLCVKADLALEQSRLRADLRAAQAAMRHVITSYSIHYTKLYESFRTSDGPNWR